MGSTTQGQAKPQITVPLRVVQVMVNFDTNAIVTASFGLDASGSELKIEKQVSISLGSDVSTLEFTNSEFLLEGKVRDSLIVHVPVTVSIDGTVDPSQKVSWRGFPTDRFDGEGSKFDGDLKLLIPELQPGGKAGFWVGVYSMLYSSWMKAAETSSDPQSKRKLTILVNP